MRTLTHNDVEFILFSGTADVFSQFYPIDYTVIWDNNEVHVTCAEMFMMYAKAITFDDVETAEKILAAPSPAACKRLGRMVKGYDDEVWEKVAPSLVVLGNYYKFMTDTLRHELLKTGDVVLVEASSWDKKWGTGLSPGATEAYILEHGKVPGRNLLGKCIMKARARMMKATKMKKATKKAAKSDE
jgi:ribA/ribD-fused uncharacterized protein